MKTSVAIYEANGDYALGILSSGWCQSLDRASRDLCSTDDNAAALDGGRWICHESCWNGASRESMKTKEPADTECKGGIRLYAVPILAGDGAAGSITMGYGAPPTDPEKLRDALAQRANDYTPRLPQIVNAAKDRLVISAKLIGQIVEGKQAELELAKAQ